MKKQSLRSLSFSILNTTFMIAFAFACLYPFVYSVFASFSNSNLLSAHEGLLLYPLNPNIESYRAAFNNPMIGSGYRNTVLILVVGLAFNMVLTIITGYVLSRKEFAIRNIGMMFITFTMFFSGGLVPFYLTVRDLHLDNSFWALVLPNAISAYNLIIMRTSLEAIPESLVESAHLDGARHLTIMFKIVVPLALPTIAVITLYYAVGHWNAWFNAMIFLRDRDKFPLQLIMREILLANDTSTMVNNNVSDADVVTVSETIQYAVMIIGTVPILTIYPFIQKYFVKGVMIGAVKG